MTLSDSGIADSPHCPQTPIAFSFLIAHLVLPLYAEVLRRHLFPKRLAVITWMVGQEKGIRSIPLPVLSVHNHTIIDEFIVA
jgi:hypothetical protein